MEFRNDEVPSGAIDGVNKVYTTAYPISNVTSLRVNGADYVDYTFTGSTLTLDLAPTATILIDYWDNTGASSPTGGGAGGSTLSEHLTAQEDYLGFSERNRLTTEKRIRAINTALRIVYDKLTGSSIVKKTGTIDVSGGVAPLPEDFNEGTLLYVGDSSTFDASTIIPELDEQQFGRLNTTDEYCVQNFDTTTALPQLEFNGVSSGTLYIEYEMGAPTLANTNDYDGLPRWTRDATAKLGAAILTQNLLKDDSKMQVALYGPTGTMSSYSPDSVWGILQRGLKRRRRNSQRSNPMQIQLIKRRRR